MTSSQPPSSQPRLRSIGARSGSRGRMVERAPPSSHLRRNGPRVRHRPARLRRSRGPRGHARARVRRAGPAMAERRWMTKSRFTSCASFSRPARWSIPTVYRPAAALPGQDHPQAIPCATRSISCWCSISARARPPNSTTTAPTSLTWRRLWNRSSARWNSRLRCG